MYLAPCQINTSQWHAFVHESPVHSCSHALFLVLSHSHSRPPLSFTKLALHSLVPVQRLLVLLHLYSFVISMLAAMGQLLEKQRAGSLDTCNVLWLFPCHLNLFGYSMLWPHAGAPWVPHKATCRFPSFPVSLLCICILYRLFTATSVACSAGQHWDNRSI